MQGRQPCVMYMDHIGSQARYASCTMMCSTWSRRPDVRVRQAVCIMSAQMMKLAAQTARLLHAHAHAHALPLRLACNC
jgi:hypothetical protein